jgi:hypothetical protein
MVPKIIAIDPGTTRSAIVEMGEGGHIISADIAGNQELLEYLEVKAASWLAIEMIASYGMPVGREVFETCVWIGKFMQAFDNNSHSPSYSYVYRKDVKMHLCGTTKAKDSNIRQALIDRFGPGKDKAIGVKASQGPLYGFKADMWAALAVAVTYLDVGYNTFSV